MNSENNMIVHTQNWVNDVIVKYNICPFARREVERGSIRYSLSEESNKENALQLLIEECDFLDKHSEVETTLFILPDGFEDFYEFLDLVFFANNLLEIEGYEGVYQLATFHPDYCFAGEPQNSPSNYTNRSPYPTLHIIREASMETAIKNHPDVDAIPERNIEFANKKGNDFFANLLASCLLNK